MITYKFNEKRGILETTFTGDVSINDITEYILILSRDNTLPKKLKIFSDASKGKFSRGVTPKDLSKLVDANKKSLIQRDFIYDAFVVSGTFEMALGILYKNLSKKKKYRFNIFSTTEAALNWLQHF